MKKLAFSAAVLVSLVAHGEVFAQNISTPSNQLRLDFSLNNSATVLDDGFDRISASESSLEGVITLQSHFGLYGEFGFGKSDVYEMEINGQSFDTDEEYTGKMFGIGYRMELSKPGRYWGFGYQNSSLNGEDSDSTDTIRTFWEKDNAKRYGVIDLSFSSDDTSGLLSVSGRHVWFLNSTVGLGVNWGIGSGYIDTPPGYSEIDAGVANLGAVLMFRPKF